MRISELSRVCRDARSGEGPGIGCDIVAAMELRPRPRVKRNMYGAAAKCSMGTTIAGAIADYGIDRRAGIGSYRGHSVTPGHRGVRSEQKTMRRL
jgi:hypothetical protein